MNQITITSLAQYIETIKKLRSYYPSNILIDNPTSHHFLYRGHSDATYQLLPGLYREVHEEYEGQTITNKKYLAWSTEQGLLNAFKLQTSSILDVPADNDLLWAVYAQHYGVPTRFLDWSANPLVALYFACKNNSQKDGMVWLFHGGNYQHFASEHTKKEDLQGRLGSMTIKEIITELLQGKKILEYPILYTPYYFDERMSAQNSYFLVWGTRKDCFEDMIQKEGLLMELPETDDGVRVFGESQQKDLLFKFYIHADRKKELIHDLDTVGINEKTLFPGLDGIGRYIERKYRYEGVIDF